MGLFGKRKATATELAALQGDVGTLQARLDQAEQASDALAARLGALTESAADRAAVDGRLDELGRRVECVAPLARRVDGIDHRLAAERDARVEGLTGVVKRADELGGRLDDLAAHGASRSQLAELGGRVNQVSARLDAMGRHGARLDELGRRLDEAAALAPRLDGLDARLGELPDHRGWLEHLEHRVDGLDDQSERFAAVHQRIDLLPDHTDWLHHLEGRLDALPDPGPALDDLGARVDGFGATAARVDDLAGRLDALADHAGRLDGLQQRLDALPDIDRHLDDVGARLGRVDRQLAELTVQTCASAKLAERLAALDARIAADATQLDVQLAELAADVEALSARSDRTPTVSSVDELRTGQTRLANEQTRFQISLREDVAGLAEQVRRLASR